MTIQGEPTALNRPNRRANWSVSMSVLCAYVIRRVSVRKGLNYDVQGAMTLQILVTWRQRSSLAHCHLRPRSIQVNYRSIYLASFIEHHIHPLDLLGVKKSVPQSRKIYVEIFSSIKSILESGTLPIINKKVSTWRFQCVHV